MTTTPNISAERAKELINHVERMSRLCERECRGVSATEWTDLIAILSDYIARQDKEDKVKS